MSDRNLQTCAQRRALFELLGVCGCGSEVRRPGRSTGPRCAKRQQRYGRQRTRSKAKLGECLRCPAPRTKGQLCDACDERRLAHEKREPLRDAKIRSGVCISSGCEGTAIDHRKCIECRALDAEAAQARFEERIAAGLCRCGKARVSTPGESCARCRARRRRRYGADRPIKAAAE